jgi:hypothetical protein
MVREAEVAEIEMFGCGATPLKLGKKQFSIDFFLQQATSSHDVPKEPALQSFQLMQLQKSLHHSPRDASSLLALLTSANPWKHLDHGLNFENISLRNLLEIPKCRIFSVLSAPDLTTIELILASFENRRAALQPLPFLSLSAFAFVAAAAFKSFARSFVGS